MMKWHRLSQSPLNLVFRGMFPGEPVGRAIHCGARGVPQPPGEVRTRAAQLLLHLQTDTQVAGGGQDEY